MQSSIYYYFYDVEYTDHPTSCNRYSTTTYTLRAPTINISNPPIQN